MAASNSSFCSVSVTFRPSRHLLGWARPAEGHGIRDLEVDQLVLEPRTRQGAHACQTPVLAVRSERTKRAARSLEIPFLVLSINFVPYRPRKRYFGPRILAGGPYSGFSGSLGAMPCRRTEMTHVRCAVQGGTCGTVVHGSRVRGMPVQGPPTNQPGGPESDPRGLPRTGRSGVCS